MFLVFVLIQIYEKLIKLLCYLFITPLIEGLLRLMKMNRETVDGETATGVVL